MVPSTLRYSPVNFLIVDWGFDGRAFDMCGMPTRPCDAPKDADTPEVCTPLPIQEAIDTYDWERWLPEVIVGIDDADEEIAANYVRSAAIEFAKGARVMQRQVVIKLEPDVSTYPLFPYDGEQIVGVIAARIDQGEPCGCAGYGQSGLVNQLEWVFDVAREELHIRNHGCNQNGLLQLLVWSAPTEDACVADRFLYDHFRNEITQAARMMYANAVHFRDRHLMASLPTGDSVARSIVIAKRKAMRTPSSFKTKSGSGMWQTGCYRRS